MTDDDLRLTSLYVREREMREPGYADAERERKRLVQQRRRAAANGNSLCKRYRDQHPDRFKVQMTVSNAVRRGHIKKEPCVVCGEIDSRAHHPDYTKPLVIVWLCQPHHSEVHELERIDRITCAGFLGDRE